MPADLPPVFGPYRIQGKLGQGGMGAVYRGLHETLERLVAIKVLPAEFANEPEYVSRFLREARTVATIRHANVVQVYDAGLCDGRYFIAMEFVDGLPLGKYLAEKGPLPEAECMELLYQAAKGLDAAHAKGLVHRDIKPDNMLLDREGQTLRVVDFGLVKDSASATQLTMAGSCLGTPQYMSPEQAAGEEADARSDLYSLGVSFYVALTGKAPFSAASVMGLLFKHQFECPPDPRTHIPGISASFAHLLLTLMAKRRSDRPASAGDLVRMIERIRAGETIPPPPVFEPASAVTNASPFAQTVVGGRPSAPSFSSPAASAPPTGRASSSKPWAIALVAGTVLLAGAAALYFWKSGSEEPRAQAVREKPRESSPAAAATIQPTPKPEAKTEPAPWRVPDAKPLAPAPEDPAVKKRERFAKEYEFARQAYVAENRALAQKTLLKALEDLGGLDHPDLRSAKDLLGTVEREIARGLAFDEAYQLGQGHLKAERFAEAKAAFAKASELWPDAPLRKVLDAGLQEADAGMKQAAARAAFSAAQEHLKSGAWKLAEEKFREARAIDEHMLGAEEGLQAARYGQAMDDGREALQKGDTARAEQAFARAAAARPGGPDARKGSSDARYLAAMQEGREAERAQAWAKAQAAYARAGRERPDDAYVRKGQAACERALAVQSCQAWIEQGKRALNTSQFPAAEAAFQKAVDACPESTVARDGLAAAKGARVDLSAKSNWKDSGLLLRAGDRVRVTASGEWKAHPLGRKVDASGKKGSPLGRVLNKDDDNHEFFSETLIGRIANGTPFYVGKDCTFTAPADGMLSFRMNEENNLMPDPLVDNDGALEVHLRWTPKSLQE